MISTSIRPKAGASLTYELQLQASLSRRSLHKIQRDLPVLDDCRSLGSALLKTHPARCVQVRIACPEEAENPNLNGQILEVEVQSLATSIGDLKQRLADVLGLPPNKQQLSREHFKNLKDIDSLAYYNVSPDVELQLSIRRRGGR